MCCALAATGCCSSNTWPVPVPYQFQDAGGTKAWRMELELPLPAACAALTRQGFAANPGACPQLQQLSSYLREISAQTTQPDGKAFAIDDELWGLLGSLANTTVLSSKRFPSQTSLPAAIRGLTTYAPMDSRDVTPPWSRPPVALNYRGMWWTFWLKAPPPPPDPDHGGTPTGSGSFDTLIVFPAYQGN